MLAQYLSYEFIALFMFITMLAMMFTGQRVFGAIGFVAVISALLVWGNGAIEMPYTATWKLFKWYPMLTLPLFIYMGFMISESGIASDLYKMFHVFFGGMKGGLAIGTMFMMVGISAMNGLSVAGMAIGATIALPEMLKRNYDKRMITGVVQAGSSLGILIPPSVVMVLYGMIARQPVSKLWLAGLLPGLLMATLFIIYIYVRCRLQPELGPVLSKEERDIPFKEKIKLLSAGIIPFVIFMSMTGLFLMGIASLVECSAVGALLATLASIYKKRLTRKVLDTTLRKTLGVSCMFMWIILAALCFGAVFDGLGAARAIETLFIERWNLTPWGVLIMMQLSYIFMGMFLDDTAMLVIVAPLYVPLIIALGFDPIWYGVLYTITCQIAYMTPPFGYNLFLMRAMAPKEITLSDIYRSITPFLLVMLFALILVMAFPQIATYLPNKYLSN
ncbi:TRAP transporter large permease subunit [Candidatus Pelagibacter sp.]|nr:TRAP transporter large permease subunit [Candidatus Pelagibacter sp.]